MKQALDPRLQPALDELYAEPVPEAVTLELMREDVSLMDKYNTLAYFKLPFTKRFDFTLAHADCQVEVFHPQPEKALPVVFFFPGTGFSVDYFSHQAAIANHFAQLTPCVVVSVNYRLAPEHPYPAAIDDCESVVKHCGDFFSQHNILADCSNYTLSGCSSGTFIANVVMQRLIQHHDKQNDFILPRALHLHVPVYDLNTNKQSCHDYGEGYLLDLPALNIMYGAFTNTDPNQAFITPEPLSAFAHIDKFPTTLITYAACDPLRDDALLYHEVLTAADVPVELLELKNMPHSITLLNSLVPNEIEKLLHAVTTFFKKTFS